MAVGDELAASIAALQALALQAQPRPDDGPTLAARKADLTKAILAGARQMALRADLAGASDLAAAQDRIHLGELFVTLGQTDEARRHLERALAIARAAVKTAPENVMAQRDRAFAAHGLAQVCLRAKQPSLARNLAVEAHAAAEAWAKGEPTNPQAKREAAICLDLLGQACLTLRDLPAARQALDQMVAAVEAYARPESPSVGGRIDLANAFITRGRVELFDHSYDEALTWYQRALDLLGPLNADGRLRPFPQEAARLDETEKIAAECRSIVQAVADIKVALKEPPETAVRLLVGRAALLARRGKPADAAATAEKLRALKPKDGANLYNVACCYALCIPAVGAGKTADMLTAEEKKERAGYTAQAVKDLRGGGPRLPRPGPHPGRPGPRHPAPGCRLPGLCGGTVDAQGWIHIPSAALRVRTSSRIAASSACSVATVCLSAAISSGAGARAAAAGRGSSSSTAPACRLRSRSSSSGA